MFFMIKFLWNRRKVLNRQLPRYFIEARANPYRPDIEYHVCDRLSKVFGKSEYYSEGEYSTLERAKDHMEIEEKKWKEYVEHLIEANRKVKEVNREIKNLNKKIANGL